MFPYRRLSDLVAGRQVRLGRWLTVLPRIASSHTAVSSPNTCIRAWRSWAYRCARSQGFGAMGRFSVARIVSAKGRLHYNTPGRTRRSAGSRQPAMQHNGRKTSRDAHRGHLMTIEFQFLLDEKRGSPHRQARAARFARRAGLHKARAADRRDEADPEVGAFCYSCKCTIVGRSFPSVEKSAVNFARDFSRSAVRFSSCVEPVILASVRASASLTRSVR